VDNVASCWFCRIPRQFCIFAESRFLPWQVQFPSLEQSSPIRPPGFTTVAETRKPSLQSPAPTPRIFAWSRREDRSVVICRAAFQLANRRIKPLGASCLPHQICQRVHYAEIDLGPS
jgi:hypothetical protein